jgi:hypothetical protein
MFTLWIFHLYVTKFQQHLQMEYTSLSWSDVRLHQDRVHEFIKMITILYRVCIKKVNKPSIIQWNNTIYTAELKNRAIYINLDILNH